MPYEGTVLSLYMKPEISSHSLRFGQLIVGNVGGEVLSAEDGEAEYNRYINGPQDTSSPGEGMATLGGLQEDVAIPISQPDKDAYSAYYVYPGGC